MLKLLVIDDSATARLTIRFQLPEDDELVVQEAGTCAEGLAEARSANPDVIFFDLNLPDGTGLDVARALRAEGACADAVFALVTSDPPLDAVMAARELGFAAILDKPPGEDAIAGLIARARAR